MITVILLLCLQDADDVYKLLKETERHMFLAEELLDKTDKGASAEQKNAIKKLQQLIDKAHEYNKQNRSGQTNKPQPKLEQEQKQSTKSNGQMPAIEEDDPINVFRSRSDESGRWGDLPPQIRQSILSGRRDIDNYPPEFRELLKEYMQALADE